MASFCTAGITQTSWFWRCIAKLNLQDFGYQKWSVLVASCTKRSAMLILGAIRSFRASGFNLFSRLKFLRLELPKRFGLWMSQDCACFLFRLRNAGAYIPKGTPCTLHVSRNFHTNACLDIVSQSHILRSCYKAVCREGDQYATYTYTKMHTPPTVTAELCQFERLTCLNQ